MIWQEMGLLRECVSDWLSNTLREFASQRVVLRQLQLQSYRAAFLQRTMLYRLPPCSLLCSHSR
jgi:hypothetical protein